MKYMTPDLAQRAILHALRGNWKEAIDLNKLILKEAPRDVDALNRLARAYAESGKVNKARILSQKALKIDPFNRIAAKAVQRWKDLDGITFVSQRTSSPEAFLEEPGKTKIAALLFPGDSRVIAHLDCGDEVRLIPHNHRVSVNTIDGRYIGRLPDDISAKLRSLIKLGNEYKILIKSADLNNLKVFIREIKRSEKIPDTPSFPPERIEYVSFTPPELVHKKEALKTSEEEI